jgi:branched-chain amino acid aminotransferase
MQAVDKIWLNGKLVDWADATVHLGAHGLHYGTGVFEGIRCYATDDGPAVFRLRDHLERFAASARMIRMQLPYSVKELRSACLDLVATNELPECYVRPIAFFGAGELAVLPRGNRVDVGIMAWPWGAYLGDDGQRNGIRAMVSSWRRVGANTIPHAAKATGVYLNSMLAVDEATRRGYDEAILLTDDGTVADGSGEHVFVVEDGTIRTPDLSASILPGITRDTIIRLAGELGYELEETRLIRSYLYRADEVFMCGTAAEVTPLRSVDDHELVVGPVTRAIQEAYLGTVRGRRPAPDDWLDRVDAAARREEIAVEL